MTGRLSASDEILCENGRRLLEWLSHSKFFAYKRIHVVKNHFDQLVIQLYSDTHKYTIITKDGRMDGDDPLLPGRRSYLGCSASTRSSRPGEDWFRGNDLPDGDCSRRTLDSIMYAIVFYEAKPVVKPRDGRTLAIED